MVPAIAFKKDFVQFTLSVTDIWLQEDNKTKVSASR